jgi:hypothetical protein
VPPDNGLGSGATGISEEAGAAGGSGAGAGGFSFFLLPALGLAGGFGSGIVTFAWAILSPGSGTGAGGRSRSFAVSTKPTRTRNEADTARPALFSRVICPCLLSEPIGKLETRRHDLHWKLFNPVSPRR